MRMFPNGSTFELIVNYTTLDKDIGVKEITLCCMKCIIHSY